MIDTLRDDIEREIRLAFQAGALAVHENYQEDREPDFQEAAYDYVASLDLAALSTDAQPAPDDDAVHALALRLAKVHDENVSEREIGAENAVKAGNGPATIFWHAIAREAITAERAKVKDEIDDAYRAGYFDGRDEKEQTDEA